MSNPPAPCSSNTQTWLVLLVLGVTMIVVTGYSFWWPGMVVTSYFTVLAGGFLVNHSFDERQR